MIRSLVSLILSIGLLVHFQALVRAQDPSVEPPATPVASEPQAATAPNSNTAEGPAGANQAADQKEGEPDVAAKPTVKYAIAIHGGAGSSAKNASEASIAKRKQALQTALEKGVGILKSGGSALDAVENVIVILENDPQFNAGKGAVFNATGSHELDASIMDGSSLRCGAVAGVSHVKNPISLARLVMTKTPHVLLSGPGAEQFAKQQNVHWVEPSYFDTPRAKASFERYKAQMEAKRDAGQQGANRKQSPPAIQSLTRMEMEVTSGFERQWSIGTVGCVVLDSNGNLAAGTSTGGMTYKQYGRVGDSPIVGAGTYADNGTCAVSSTGIGEQYIRNVVAYDIAAQMKYKKVTLEEAVKNNLESRLQKGDGGLIAVDAQGNISMGFNTEGMARAAADSEGRFEIIWGDSTTSPTGDPKAPVTEKKK